MYLVGLICVSLLLTIYLSAFYEFELDYTYIVNISERNYSAILLYVNKLYKHSL